MNVRMTVLCLLCIAVARPALANEPPAPTVGTAMVASGKEDERAKLAGEWSGNAAIIVAWVKQKSLPLRLNIAADGTVTGSVGDAALRDAKFISNALGSTRFRVHGRLEGNLVDAEEIRRDAVDILFNVADDGSLVGGLHSSGSKFGGSKSMKLSATKMVLKRAEPAEQ